MITRDHPAPQLVKHRGARSRKADYKAMTQGWWAFGAILGSLAGAQIASLLGRRRSAHLVKLVPVQASDSPSVESPPITWLSIPSLMC